MRRPLPVLLLAASAVAGCRRDEGPHVVALSVAPAGAAQRAGLQAGDLLASWERGGSKGRLESPFALALVELDRAPGGTVTLHGRRGFRPRSWTMPAGPWGLEARPPLDDHALVEAARRSQALGDGVAAGRAWQTLAEHLASDAAAWALLQAGRAWVAAHRPEDAARCFDRAFGALAGRPDWLAVARDQAGDALRAAGALREAADAYRQALELREAASPRSLAAAQSHYQLGRLARRRGDVESSLRHLEAARELREALAPDGPELALVLHDLGAVAFARGQLDAAAAMLDRAREIQQRRVPDGLQLANTLSALGGVASQRSEFAQAEALHRRALAITQRLAPQGVEHAYVLNRLGVVAREQGDLEEAEDYHRRGLGLFERALPGGIEVAGSLNNLGLVAQARRDWAAAEGFHLRALAIRETLNPAGGDVAASLNNLGAVARERNDLPAAEAYLQRSLAIKRKAAPASLTLGASLHNLGEVLLGQRRFAEARASLREALAIRARLAPGSGDEAADWHSLGLVDKEQDLRPAALAKWRRALDIMDSQRDKLKSGDRAGFIARYAVVYQDPIDLLLAEKRYAEAFAVRERLQARAMLSLFSRRGQVPADEPRPLDLASTRAALDPGVTLLAYVVLRRSTAVFVVRGAGVPGPGVTAFTVPQDAQTLRDRVVAFRGLIERGRDAPDIEPALLAQGQRLYDDLVKPAESALEGAERILISADGPLHLLPFAALVRQRQPVVFLAEWKPLPTVASASVYAAIKRSRRAAADRSPRLAAFGDPALAGISGPQADARAASASSGLRPLPFSREEVDRIVALFGAGAQRFVGEEATEEQALLVGKDVRYLHFATHGLLDARSPLDSALVLAQPARPQSGENGLLQAWEVRDRLHLDADLVTLSACESGLGREATAEGLIGLGRAFQHAGARSVLASLWAITDRSTARFMESFYQRLRGGAARDRALQEAQVESLRQGAHPYHWAAFQLSGDWQ